MEILCFFAGTTFAYTHSIYSVLFLIIACILYAHLRFILYFLAAILWSMAHQWWFNAHGMPNLRFIPKTYITGTIVSIPIKQTLSAQFYFLANALDNKHIAAKILLSCYYHCPNFNLGDTWQFQVKLKAPRNLGNPGRFDYINWLNAQHVHWVGYIVPHTAKFISHNKYTYPLLYLREYLAISLAKLTSDNETLGIMQALTLGITKHISQQQWELFRQTGTTHLMVISGAHIGLIAGLCFKIIQWLWLKYPKLCLYYPATQVASIISFVAASCYAIIAGLAPSTQRALIAYYFFIIKNILTRYFSMWQAWRYALLIILFLEPHDVLLPGFYLSFLAVASLLLAHQRFNKSGLRKLLYLQVICLFGLMPLTLLWFSYGAINSIFANLIAIPFVGFIIVPLALVSLLLAQIYPNPIILLPVHYAIKLLLYYLKLISFFSYINLNDFSINLMSALSLMLAVLVYILIPIKKILLANIILTYLALFPGHIKINPGVIKLHILDVGQGLSVIVRTSNHLLVYDTGMQFNTGSDMAKLAIIPFLRSIGIKKINKVIISHPDLDHRGGLSSLQKKYAIDELIVNDPGYFININSTNCHDYPAWQWDEVSFHFLPIKHNIKGKNNNSCILKIDNTIFAVLLTGDIEKIAENYLINKYTDQLHATVLLVPHHGSKTSSSLAFVKQVAPKFAIISAGIDNRYHFPHAITLHTYNQEGIKLFSTVNCGMITVSLPKNKALLPEIACYNTSQDTLV